MYVSSWPVLSFRELFPRPSEQALPYPLSARQRHSFCLARSGIYHLFRSLKLQPGEAVLAPDYYSGNEVAAIKAAGGSLVHYPIGRNFEPDLGALERLAREIRPRVIYVIHYLGWAQPMDEIQAICRRYGSILVEDCALAMLSESNGKPLGSTGDYSVFCLYKTLPVPNGGLLVQNTPDVPPVSGMHLRPCSPMDCAGRSTELLLEAVRSRFNTIGAALFAFKRAIGRSLRAASFQPVKVGDIGWNLANVNVGMSSLSDRVMTGLDYAAIRARRRRNYMLMQQKLCGRVAIVREDLEDGICPLFFPILVKNKWAVAQALRNRGIGAVEFWNDPQDNPSIGPAARFLRAHLLELPIHQGVTESQVEYISDQVLRLNPLAAVC
jgi:dTDP-4-amino-4,6-dideoxygalactose transaminase